MTTRVPTQRVLAAAVMQQAWRAGDRRVSLFCADELRPAACCVVDALLTRGYDVQLATGAEARDALRTAGSAEVLRVVWAPDSGDAATRARLRSMLDPDAAGDVMILASATPRGVIDAIDAFGAPKRKRLRTAPRRKTYLAQPTLLERKVDARGFTTSAMGAAAIVVAVLGGLWATSGGAPVGSGAPAPISASLGVEASETMSAQPATRTADTVLASTRAPLELADPSESAEEEPLIIDDQEAVAPRASAPRPQDFDDDRAMPIEAAPLEVSNATPSASDRVASPMPALAPSGGMPMNGPNAMSASRPRAIDPF